MPLCSEFAAATWAPRRAYLSTTLFEYSLQASHLNVQISRMPAEMAHGAQSAK